MKVSELNRRCFLVSECIFSPHTIMTAVNQKAHFTRKKKQNCKLKETTFGAAVWFTQGDGLPFFAVAFLDPEFLICTIPAHIMHLECRALNHSTDIAKTTVVGNFAVL